VHELLTSWKCDHLVIGICFDTTASNTGKVNRACPVLEARVGRNLLWMVCRHHILEVLLFDAFSVCFRPPSRPDVLIFKRFRDKWSEIVNQVPKERLAPFILVCDELKVFMTEQLTLDYPRVEYKKLLCLAALMIGIQTNTAVRKPGAHHRARWMVC